MGRFVSRLGEKIKATLSGNITSVLFVVLGGVLVFVGFHFDAEPIRTVGVAIISSGVITAVTMSKLFSQIFLDITHDVVFGEKHLGLRKDIEEVWSRVTNVACQQRFPELSDKINSKVLNDYLPKTRDFFYENISREYILKDFEEEDQSLLCEENIRLDIVPHKGVQKYSYTYTIEFCREEEIKDLFFLLDGNKLSIEKSRPKQKCKTAEILTTWEDGKIRCSIEFSGGSHTLTRSKKTRISMQNQPYIRVSYATYVKALRIMVRSEVSSIYATLIEKKAFVDSMNRERKLQERASTFNVDAAELLMPHQGHTLLLCRQPC